MSTKRIIANGVRQPDVTGGVGTAVALRNYVLNGGRVLVGGVLAAVRLHQVATEAAAPLLLIPPIGDDEKFFFPSRPFEVHVHD